MNYEMVVKTEDGIEYESIHQAKQFDSKYTIYVKIVDDDGEVLAMKPCGHELHANNTIKKLERDGIYLLETIRLYGENE